MDCLLECDFILATAMQLVDYLEEDKHGLNVAGEEKVDWIEADYVQFGNVIKEWESQCRSDNGRKWLKTTLRNYLIREYQSLNQVTVHFIKANAPEWAKKAAEEGSLRIISDGPSWRNFKEKIDHVVDYFSADESLKLERVSVDAAIEASDKWLKSMLKKKIQDEDEAGLQEVRTYSGGFRWVRLISPPCLEREGKMMGHCVGGYSHAVMTGSSWIFSLRDSDGEAHCTIEYNPSSKTLRQAKGKQNKAVVDKYREFVRDFLTNPPTGVAISSVYESIEYLGLAFINGQLMDLATLPDGLTVEGDLRLSRAEITELPKRLTIKGAFDLPINLKKIPDGLTANEIRFSSYHKDVEIGDNVTVNGEFKSGSAVKKIGKNFTVGAGFDLSIGSQVESLGDGLKVGKSLLVSNNQMIRTWPKNMDVARSVRWINCSIEKVPDGLNVAGNLVLKECSIEEVGSNIRVGREIDFSSSKIEKLGTDIRAKAGIQMYGCEIKQMPQKLKMSGSVYLSRAKIEKMSKEVSVSGELLLSGAVLDKLPTLWKVGKSLVLGGLKAGNVQVTQDMIRGEVKEIK